MPLASYREIGIDDLLRPLAGRDVALLPNNGNVGDALIHAATLQVLERLEIRPRLVEGDGDERGEVLLAGGGGNLTESYDHLLPRLVRLAGQFDEVVVLPHSVFGEGVVRALGALGPGVTVVCRERVSYDLLRAGLGDDSRLWLAPDMSFAFDYEPFRSDGGQGVLNAFRRDCERLPTEPPPDNEDLSQELELPGRPYRAEFWRLPYWRAYVEAFLRRIGSFGEIRTNRLHIGIAAAMLGKTVELHDNSYHKVRGVYEYSLAAFPRVRYASRPAPISRAAGMRLVTLHPPRVEGSRISFRFDVDPPSPLYRATSFALVFPEWMDLAGLPPRLLWTVFLLLVHGQWPYLAPCRVRLPVGLSDGEREFWERLVQSYVQTLEAHRTGATPGGGVTLVAEGSPLPPFPRLPDAGWCGAAFSGGKDSLLHVGLLAELGHRPLVVTTTSPRSDLHDQGTARRRQVLAEIGRRRDLVFVEVTSDIRSTWLNQFPFTIGYPVSVNETNDTFLYTAALLVAGAALGATHLFLASEADIQESVEREGVVIQHPHYMYSAATQRALSAWLAPAGIRYGSLTWPLRSGSVVEILWRRYPDLADLQYSCWMVMPDQAACSHCDKCFRVALAILAAGGRPARTGVDLSLLADLIPGWTVPAPPGAETLPRDRYRAQMDAAVVRFVQATSSLQFLAALVDGQPRRLAERRTWRAWAAYRGLRRRLSGVTVGALRAHEGFLNQVDPLVRDRLRSIYGRWAHPWADPASSDLVDRSERLTRWIVAPLNPGQVSSGRLA